MRDRQARDVDRRARDERDGVEVDVLARCSDGYVHLGRAAARCDARPGLAPRHEAVAAGKAAGVDVVVGVGRVVHRRLAGQAGGIGRGVQAQRAVAHAAGLGLLAPGLQVGLPRRGVGIEAQVEALANELDNFFERFVLEYDLTPYDLLAALQMKSFMIMNEIKDEGCEFGDE